MEEMEEMAEMADTKIKAFCEDHPSCRHLNVLNMPPGVVISQGNGLLIVLSEMTQKQFLALLVLIVRFLPFLEVLKVQASVDVPANVTELPEFLFTGLSNLSALFLSRCVNLYRLPTNLGRIASNLKTLQISECPRITRLPPNIGMLQELNSHMETWCDRTRDQRIYKLQLHKLKEDYPINVKVAFMTLLCSERYFVEVVDSLVHVPPEIWWEIFSYFEIF